MITVDSILNFDFSALSVADRLKVIRKIEDTLGGGTDSFVLTANQKAEYDRRYQEALQHPDRLLTLDELKARR